MDNPYELFVNNQAEQDFLFASLKPEMYVLEYGSGKSTLALAKRCRKLVSVEHTNLYFKQTQDLLNINNIANVELLLVHPENPDFKEDGTYEEFSGYIEEPFAFAALEKFDFIFIDGRARVGCAQFANRILKPGGIIFIHDYGHPDEKYRRKEYEVVEEILTKEETVFAMTKFKLKGNI